MNRTSIVTTTHNYIRLTRSRGKRFLQLAILQLESIIELMPWMNFPKNCMCIKRAQINLEPMMVTSLSFFVIPIFAAYSWKFYAVISARDICTKNRKMQSFRMESSCACPTLIGCPGFLGSANTIYLCTGSLMRISRSRGALYACQSLFQMIWLTIPILQRFSINFIFLLDGPYVISTLSGSISSASFMP